MFKVTIKGLLAHKARLTMTALATVLGVGLVAGTLVLTDTVGKTFDQLFATVGEGTDAEVRSSTVIKSPQGAEQRGLIDASLLAAVLSAPGVAAAEGEVGGYAQYVGKDGKAIGDPGRGAPTLGMNWTDNSKINPFHTVEGRAPERDGEVIMDRGTASKGGFHPGDKVKILTQAGPVEMDIVGIAKFGDIDSPLGASVAGFTLDDAQRYIGKPGMFNDITVVAATGVSQQDVVDSIRKILPGGTEAITGETLVKENQSSLRESLSFFNTFLMVFALVAVLVGVFIIYNTFAIIVAQRTRELALLRALGAGRWQVMVAVIGEATIVGVLASVVGLAFGVVVAGGLKAMLAGFGLDIPSTGTVVEPRTFVVGFVVGIGATTISAAFPAWRGAKTPPIAALRDVSVDRTATSLARTVIGFGITVLGMAILMLGLFADIPNRALAIGPGAFLTFIGVAVFSPVIASPVSKLLGAPIAALRGIPGQLAMENAARTPRRTATTASALMIGVGLVGMVSILGASMKASIYDIFDRSFTGDFVIDSGTFGFGGLSPDIEKRLAAIAGVDAVMPIRMTTVKVNGEPGFMPGLDPVAGAKLFDIGVTEGSVTGMGPGGIAISTQYAKDKGLKIGDTVPVVWANAGEVPMKVGAIYSNKDLVGPYVVDLVAFSKNVPEQLDAQVYVGLAGGVAGDDVRAAIEQAAAAYPNAKVEDLAQFKEAQAAQIDSLVNMMQVLLMLAVVIAFLGIVNTLGLSISERVREIGLLRAVGMGRGEVRAAIRWESVIIAVFGTGLGIGIGVFFGWAIVQALRKEGISVFVIPAGQLAAMVAVATVSAVIAGMIPAFKASRLDVLDAISHE